MRLRERRGNRRATDRRARRRAGEIDVGEGVESRRVSRRWNKDRRGRCQSHAEWAPPVASSFGRARSPVTSTGFHRARHAGTHLNLCFFPPGRSSKPLCQGLGCGFGLGGPPSLFLTFSRSLFPRFCLRRCDRVVPGLETRSAIAFVSAGASGTTLRRIKFSHRCDNLLPHSPTGRCFPAG